MAIDTTSDTQPDTQKVATISAPVVDEALAKLREVFPHCIKDGKIDLDVLKALFDAEDMLAGTEKYGLSWAGKSDAFRAIQIPATGTLAPQKNESKDWDTTENMFIEGDNLEVLKLLQKRYYGAIKMIYIDPPYNTGKDFVYKDNFTERVADYYERTGQTEGGIKMTANTEKNGRYHSDWLSMMYPRLFLAKNLLREDGVIFVSIDDNEVANLRLIMDEIFGEENFVAQVVWEKMYTVKNDASFVSNSHEYVLVYARNIETVEILLLPRTTEMDSRYTNPDNDPRGEWKAIPMYAKGESKGGRYVIKSPSGKEFLPEPNTHWRYGVGDVEKLLAENRIYFGKTGQSQPNLKRFLSEVQQGLKVRSLWSFDDVGSNDSAKKELRELFNQNIVFDFPKPVSLIKRMIQIGTVANESEIILDFFAGSGTTAHAVMAQNAEDGGNRKWICVQIPEETDEESEAHKAGYNTISAISRERIRRAGDQIGKGDIGFKAFSLSPSNYRKWRDITADDDEETLKAQMRLFAEKPLVDGYDEESVVYEVMLKEGMDMHASVRKEQGTLAPWIIESGKKGEGKRTLVVSFAKKVTKEQVDALKLAKEDTFVCLDGALDDTTKVNISRSVNLKVI